MNWVEGNVIVYYLYGRVLAIKRDEGTLLRFDVPATGTYLIRIGDAPARRIVVVRWFFYEQFAYYVPEGDGRTQAGVWTPAHMVMIKRNPEGVTRYALLVVCRPFGALFCRNDERGLYPRL